MNYRYEELYKELKQKKELSSLEFAYVICFKEQAEIDHDITAFLEGISDTSYMALCEAKRKKLNRLDELYDFIHNY